MSQRKFVWIPTLAALLLTIASPAAGQLPMNFRVLPQFIFGGASPGWYSAVVLCNPGDTQAFFPVHFFNNNGQPVAVPGPNGITDTQNVLVLPKGMAIIEAPADGPITEGWVALELPPGMYANGVYRLSVAGQPDQEAVVPLSGNTSQDVFMAFDDREYPTTRTGVAITNPSATATVVTITARDEQGTSQGKVLGTKTINLDGRSKVTLFLSDADELTGMRRKKGTVEFTVPTGAVAVVGLRARGLAFTSIPTVER
jgi:hypothetical protein